MKLHQLLTALLLSITCVSSVEGQSLSYGDVNGDGAIDIADVNYLLASTFEAGPASIIPAAEVSDTPGRFVDNGDATITDNDTGLMWLKGYLGSATGSNINSTDAVAALADLNATSQYSDWFIPTIGDIYATIPTSAYMSDSTSTTSVSSYFSQNNYKISALQGTPVGYMIEEANTSNQGILRLGSSTALTLPNGWTQNQSITNAFADGLSRQYISIDLHPTFWGVGYAAGSLIMGRSCHWAVVRNANQEPTVPGDVNGDGVLDITDPVALLNYLFEGGDAPVAASFALEDPYYGDTASATNRFQDNLDGTTTDLSTGLMWNTASTIDPTSGYTWLDLNADIAAINAADTYSDWRLPTIQELLAIQPWTSMGHFFVSASCNNHPTFRVTSNNQTPSYYWAINRARYMNSGSPLALAWAEGRVTSSSNYDCSNVPSNLTLECENRRAVLGVPSYTDFIINTACSGSATDRLDSLVLSSPNPVFTILVRKAN